MNLKPWREIARPHKDVLEGRFKQAEFAADISQVAGGSAPAEYQDAEKFFARTFITEGMRLLLKSVVQRLAGQGGDPVIQLQTAFGGGKTHAMLAVYHLASRRVSTSQLEGIPSILDEADISDLPQTNIAVIDGVSLSPSQELVKKDGQKITTLWGEMANQLLGERGLDMVRESHEQGTSPGKTLLIELLKKSAPCVVLIDELVAFLRQFEPGKSYSAGTFDSNLSFIQALTEAMKAVPNAILLATLPESELEAGGVAGQRALNVLEKCFGRVESVWKPVAAEESFEIVRRRLFEHAGNQAEVEDVCRQFSDFYKKNSSKFPSETQSSLYFERLCKSYPIHSEVFDRLYKDWSTLEKFQRTRGVLQYMAVVIHRLWNSENNDALIMPGSIALDDTNIRNISIRYLPQGWEPIIEREVDGSSSEPYKLDGHDTRFGKYQAARRTTRTLFLGSAPETSGQAVRGLQTERVLLGAVQPNQTVGTFEDALKRLRDRLHHLYSDQDRSWFDTKPTLRREMESRKQSISETDKIRLLHNQVNRAFGSGRVFSGIHVFTSSADIPDECGWAPRLVVLPLSAGYSRTDKTTGEAAALEVLMNRGKQSRQKRNRLIFLLPDLNNIDRLKEVACVLLAWSSIIDDIEAEKLDLSTSQARQAKDSKEQAVKMLGEVLRDTYKWLLCPYEEMNGENDTFDLMWESATISPSTENLTTAIEQKLEEREWLITQWSPIHLKRMLGEWYFKNKVSDVNARKVYQDTCCYLYLPRLRNNIVFEDAIAKGIASDDFFGYASAKDTDKYLGFVFGKEAPVVLNETSVLIEQSRATDYRKTLEPENEKPTEVKDGDDKGKTQPGSGDTVGTDETAESAVRSKTSFYGSVQVEPIKAKMDFAQICDEIIEQFTSQPGVDVTIAIEIQATSKKGFDESKQRTIKENCGVLKFKSAEFED